MAKKAADYGINYGLEVVNRYETNILNTSYQVSHTRAIGMVLHQRLACMCMMERTLSMFPPMPACGDLVMHYA